MESDKTILQNLQYRTEQPMEKLEKTKTNDLA